MTPLAKHINCPPLHIFSSQLEAKALHDQFVALGRQRNKLTYQLLELLPAIFERKIYQKHGCATIEEYAGRFAGLPKSVVKKRLRLERNLADKPALKALVGTEGVHKVALVANLATALTDRAWADKVRNMSKAGLETLAKEMRGHVAALTGQKIESNKQVSGTHQILCSAILGNNKPVFCSAASEKITIELTGDLLFLFLKMKKRVGKDLSHFEALKKMLEELEAIENVKVQTCSPSFGQTGASKDKQVETQKDTGFVFRNEASSNFARACGMEGEKYGNADGNNNGRTTGPDSRYIPSTLRKMTLASTGGKCAYPNCQHPYELFHHRERFANHKNHASIIPLCKKHHEFMHNGLIVHEKSDPEKWTIEISD